MLAELDSILFKIHICKNFERTGKETTLTARKSFKTKQLAWQLKGESSKVKLNFVYLIVIRNCSADVFAGFIKGLSRQSTSFCYCQQLC